MLEIFNEFIRTIYNDDKTTYGLLTLGIMAGLGSTISIATELILRILGIKGGAH